MNVLNQEVTRTFFADEAGYAALEKHWSALVNSSDCKKLGPAHYLLYQALRGKDWRKGFAPIANQRKLENGAFYNWGLYHALRWLHSSWGEEQLLEPFGGVIDLSMLEKVRSVLPKKISDFEIPQAYETRGDGGAGSG